MDAMIFAAGYGTRLRPLTDTTPKALVDVGGKTLLERVASRLVAAGADRLIVNTHHHADQIERFVSDHDLGAEVVLSYEPEAPMDTGGGLLFAKPHFRGDGPFVIHNVDIVSDMPLEAMLAFHEQNEALVTLAVMERDTSRVLLFDDEGLLGHRNRETDQTTVARDAVGEVREWPFCGVHVVSPEALDRITETGRFSIFTPYLRLVAEGERILPFPVDGSTWIDVGRPDTLARARDLVRG